MTTINNCSAFVHQSNDGRPLLTFGGERFSQHHVTERIKQINIYSLNQIEFITVSNSRSMGTLKSQIPDDSTKWNAFFTNVYGIITQAKHGYVLTTLVRGLGGGQSESQIQEEKEGKLNKSIFELFENKDRISAVKMIFETSIITPNSRITRYHPVLSNGDSAFYVMMKSKREDVLKLGISLGADVNLRLGEKKDYLPLDWAVENGWKDGMEILLKKGAKLTPHYNDRLIALSSNPASDIVSIVDSLRDNGINLLENASLETKSKALLKACHNVICISWARKEYSDLAALNLVSMYLNCFLERESSIFKTIPAYIFKTLPSATQNSIGEALSKTLILLCEKNVYFRERQPDGYVYYDSNYCRLLTLLFNFIDPKIIPEATIKKLPPENQKLISDSLGNYTIFGQIINCSVKNKEELLREHIASGADINFPVRKDSTRLPLDEAIEKKWLEGVRILLANGAKPSSVDSLCSQMANNSLYNEAVIQLLANHGIMVLKDANPKTKSKALLDLCQANWWPNSKIEILTLLLRNSADPKAVPANIFEELPRNIQDLLKDFTLNESDRWKISNILTKKICDGIDSKLETKIHGAEKTNELKEIISRALKNAKIFLIITEESDDKMILMRKSFTDFIVEKLNTILGKRSYFDDEKRTLNTSEIESYLNEAILEWKAGYNQTLADKIQLKQLNNSHEFTQESMRLEMDALKKQLTKSENDRSQEKERFSEQLKQQGIVMASQLKKAEQDHALQLQSANRTLSEINNNLRWLNR